ncbi:hypothetical protein CLOM_g18445 [Closterium sp. NIES-68]|nr:hypothetical protein CLOM_g18445 [Closterium sp. NIES-68]
MDASCSLRLEAGCALSLGPIWQSQDRLERSLDSAARQNSNDGLPPSRKRVREDGASEKDAPSSKASREKLRRDRLNDRFLELARELDHRRPPGWIRPSFSPTPPSCSCA